MKIEFTSDIKKMQDVLDELTKKVQPLATSTAINRTTTHVIKVAKQGIAKETGITQKHFKKRLNVAKKDKAKPGKLLAIIWVGLWGISVRHLTPKPRALKSGSVKYKTLPGQPLDPKAFMVNDSAGSTAYSRKGSSRLPIGQKMIDISGPMRRNVERALGADAKSFFRKTFYSEMEGRVIKAMQKKGMTVR